MLVVLRKDRLATDLLLRLAMVVKAPASLLVNIVTIRKKITRWKEVCMVDFNKRNFVSLNERFPSSTI